MKKREKYYYNLLNQIKTIMKVINGNNIEILKEYPDNYFDAIVTDPPYGLGKEPNAEELMRDWIEKGYHEISGSGFMGKEWDAFVPQPVFWKEVFRVLKYGGHVLAFYGTRTYDWGVMSMRFAGFEVRDCIQWLYGSGFPKSHNISKAIDKMYGAEREIVGEKVRGDVQKAKENGSGYLSDPANRNNEKQFGYGTELITKPATDQAKEWEGWGSALKPANEPIVLARKPLEKGLSIAENVLKWGTGAINIDGCRVNTNGEKINIGFSGKILDEKNGWNNNDVQRTPYDDSKGRFPANLILTHHPECECVGTKKVKSGNGENTMTKNNIERENVINYSKEKNQFNYGEEEIEDWNCHPDCPIKLLDEQSGESKSQRSQRGNVEIFKKENSWIGNSTDRGHNDKGGASRFFYVAKASKSERNKGLDGFEEKVIDGRDEGQDARNVAYKPRPTPMANVHPTVKPIKLMQYLVRLITPPNGIVLDPFCGSGTTGIACKLEGFDFIGLEQDPEYCKIAQARIDNYVEDKPNKKNNSENSEKDTEDKQMKLF